MFVFDSAIHVRGPGYNMALFYIALWVTIRSWIGAAVVPFKVIFGWRKSGELINAALIRAYSVLFMLAMAAGAVVAAVTGSWLIIWWTVAIHLVISFLLTALIEGLTALVNQYD